MGMNLIFVKRILGEIMIWFLLIRIPDYLLKTARGKLMAITMHGKVVSLTGKIHTDGSCGGAAGSGYLHSRCRAGTDNTTFPVVDRD